MVARIVIPLSAATQLIQLSPGWRGLSPEGHGPEKGRFPIGRSPLRPRYPFSFLFLKPRSVISFQHEPREVGERFTCRPQRFHCSTR